MSYSKYLIAALFLGLALLMLAGCASPTPTPLPPAPTAVPPTVAPTKAPTTVPTTAPTVAPTKAAASSSAASSSAASSAASEAPQPNCGKADCTKSGPAITQNLKGDATAGLKVFTDNCEKCHGKLGTTGIDNPGSTDGTVPNLNPIDPGFSTKDAKAFATQLDAFIEHGSTPDGPSPKNVMDSWGDSNKLTPQQIADVIAYVMSLNK
jgi:mono/diheme cytochrome c family protein